MFHVVPLTLEKVREGILFQVTDALSDEFSATAEAAQARGYGDKEQMLVHFDNSATNEHFQTEWGEDVLDVLYLNDAAKSAVEKAGIHLEYKEPVDTLPTHVGLAGRMYRFL